MILLKFVFTNDFQSHYLKVGAFQPITFFVPFSIRKLLIYMQKISREPRVIESAEFPSTRAVNSISASQFYYTNPYSALVGNFTKKQGVGLLTKPF